MKTNISSPVVKNSTRVLRSGIRFRTESIVAIETCCRDAYSGSIPEISRRLRASSCSLSALVSELEEEGSGRSSGCERAEEMLSSSLSRLIFATNDGSARPWADYAELDNSWISPRDLACSHNEKAD